MCRLNNCGGELSTAILLEGVHCSRCIAARRACVRPCSLPGATAAALGLPLCVAPCHTLALASKPCRVCVWQGVGERRLGSRLVVIDLIAEDLLHGRELVRFFVKGGSRIWVDEVYTVVRLRDIRKKVIRLGVHECLRSGEVSIAFVTRRRLL